MNRMLRLALFTAFALALHASAAAAQTFDAAGTRAAGMAGAFVAVADDASAVYWNPAGLASGAYFSAVLGRRAAEAAPQTGPRAGNQSGFMFALGMPALGLSYYRLRATTLQPTAAIEEAPANRNLTAVAEVRVSSLVTHHTGVTLVQSIVPGLAVGATLKLVRGVAAEGIEPDGDRGDILGMGADLVGQASNRFDADLGVMATAGRLRAGLTVRNLTEPEFETAGGGNRLRLDRQARAGIAVSPHDGWSVAADLDLLDRPGLTGRIRDFAIGAEGRVVPRGFVRAGVRMNTFDTASIGRVPTAAFGGSYGLTASVLLDGQVTLGSSRAPRGWGVSARFVY